MTTFSVSLESDVRQTREVFREYTKSKSVVSSPDITRQEGEKIHQSQDLYLSFLDLIVKTCVQGNQTEARSDHEN